MEPQFFSYFEKSKANFFLADKVRKIRLPSVNTRRFTRFLAPKSNFWKILPDGNSIKHEVLLKTRNCSLFESGSKKASKPVHLSPFVQILGPRQNFEIFDHLVKNRVLARLCKSSGQSGRKRVLIYRHEKSWPEREKARPNL